jgi:hypothetical protein
VAKAVAVRDISGGYVLTVAIDQRTDDRASVVIFYGPKPGVRVVAQTGSTAELVTYLEGSVYLSGRFSGVAGELQMAGLRLPRRWNDNDYVVKLGLDGKGVWARGIGGSAGGANLTSMGVDPAGGLLLGGICVGDLRVGDESAPADPDVPLSSVIAHLNQAGGLDWARLLGGTNYNRTDQVVADGWGNICAVGTFEESVQLGDVRLTMGGWIPSKRNNYLAVLRRTPEFDWAHRNGDGAAWGSEVATDLNGNRFVVGGFSGPTAVFGDLTVTNQDLFDGFVAKFDPAGKALWVRSIGGPDNQSASSVAVDGNGNVYAFGYAETSCTIGTNVFTAASDRDGFLAKYGPDGDVLWARQIKGSWVRNYNRVRTDRGGAVYVAGAFSGTIDFGAASLTSTGLTDAFLAKYSGSGTFQWARRGGGPESTAAKGLAVDGAGNAVLVGTYLDEARFGGVDLPAGFDKEVFVVKYDTVGNVKWARNGAGGSQDLAEGAAIDAEGNIYVTGSFSAKLQFGAKAAETSASIASFIAKFDGDGTPQWVTSAGSTGRESEGLGVAVSRDGRNVYVCGLYDAALEAGLWRLESGGGYDAFLLQYGGDGEVRWAKSAGGTGYDLAASVAVDVTGTWAVTGRYSEDATFDQHVLQGTPNSRFFLTSSTPIRNPRTLIPLASETGLGAELRVPIQLNSRGNEMGVSFSLVFDPAVLRFIKCENGDRVSCQTLLVNQSQAAQGRLGIGLNAASCAGIQSGPKEVVIVTFRVAPDTTARETLLTFADQPVARKAVAGDAFSPTQDLPLDCQQGTVKIVRGYEADVVEPFKKVTAADLNRIGNLAMGIESIADRDTFERADCAPYAVDGSPLLGDGEVNLNDWVQAGRFVLGLDPLTVQGGSTGPFSLMTRPDSTRSARRLSGLNHSPSTLRLVADGWKPGLTNECVLRLEAVGGENAVSFSLLFDPGLLVYVDAALGAGVKGATLMVNGNNAGQGQLGVLLFLPFGEELAAGSHELLRLRFAVSAFAEAMGTQLLFGDYPAARDIAGARGSSLPAEYVNATLDFRAIALRITRAVLDQGHLQVETEGGTGWEVVIQSSTDMGTWRNVATNTTGIGSVRIPWSPADAVRYFRAMVP